MNFVVTTDSPALPEIRLCLSADLVQKCEVVADTGNGRVVTGRVQDLRYKLVIRQEAGEPREFPTISATPWNAFYAGVIEEQGSASGVIETARKFVLKVPAIPDAGLQSGQVRLRWPDGREDDLSVTLVVAPSLVAKPSAIILNASNTPVTKTVILRSDVAPFRVKGVTGRDSQGVPRAQG